jgi:hypothetical protein
MNTVQKKITKLIIFACLFCGPRDTFAGDLVLEFKAGAGLAILESDRNYFTRSIPIGGSLYYTLFHIITVGASLRQHQFYYDMNGISKHANSTLGGFNFGLISKGERRWHLSVDYYPLADLYAESDITLMVNEERYRHINRTTYKGPAALEAHLAYIWLIDPKPFGKRTRLRQGISLSYFQQQTDFRRERVVIIRPNTSMIDTTAEFSDKEMLRSLHVSFIFGMEFL